MNQKRSNNYEYNQEFLFNKNAFDDVIGDPFALEPVQGHYMKLQSRSSIRVANNEFDMGKATKNAAQPNVTDFICDVDRIISIGLEDPKLVLAFYDTYIFETTETAFTPKERVVIEQKIGKLFRRYKISPVSKYFQCIRKGGIEIDKRKARNVVYS